MYCSGCGTQIHSDLNYCDRCGSKVAKSDSASVAENLSQSVGYIGGFGLLGFIFLILVLVKKGVPPNYLIPISFFYLATLFGICLLLIQQAGQLTKSKRVKNSKADQVSPPAYLRPVITAQLHEAHDDGIGSITENTTRTLEEVPVKRQGSSAN